MISILAALLATTAVYRLELQDDTPYIVGSDGVRRQVCLVEPAEYAMMTGKVDQVWRSLNSTDEGRRQLHGVRLRTEVDTNRLVRVTVYKDGYRHTEAMEVKSPSANRPSVNKKQVIKVKPNNNVSERHRKFIEALKARSLAKPKEVTIEHNAATGKDEVK